MDNDEIILDDTVSQYSTVAGSGQDIEESTRHGTTQGSASQPVDETVTVEQKMFLRRAKTVFEVNDEHTAEDAKKFLKVSTKIYS